jgi:hypothetical protein
VGKVMVPRVTLANSASCPFGTMDCFLGEGGAGKVAGHAPDCSPSHTKVKNGRVILALSLTAIFMVLK